jgi:hypothetical protein
MTALPHGARLDITALPLPPDLRRRLQCAGFRTTADLKNIQPLDLAQGPLINTHCMLIRAQGFMLAARSHFRLAP